MTSNHERGTYIALTGVVWGAGCILGPVIGGGFSVSAATWRWSFYINLVIAAVSAPVYFLYLPSMSFDTETPRHTKLAQIDWLGVLLSIGAWVSFTMVLTFAGATWPWHDGRTIALFVVFGVILTAFMLLQYFLIGTTGQHRIFAAHMLKSHSQVLISFGTGSAITGMFVPVYYIPLYFQFVQGDTALLAAVRLLPFVLVAITTNMVAGALLPRIGY
jgi:MFS family permease